MSAIKYDTDVDINVIDKMTTALNALDDVKVIFNSVDTKLSDESKWAGIARDKCIEVHEVIKQYEKTIRPVCDQLKKLLTELDTNVTNFTWFEVIALWH